MIRRVLAAAPALAFAALACAPDQPAATATCTSIRDCPLREVCDRVQKTCIPEPADRFTGAFSCKIEVPGGPNLGVLQLSEVVGRLDRDRYTLPGVFCLLDDTVVTLGFAPATAGGAYLSVYIDAAKARSGRVTLKPALGGGNDDAAILDDPDIGKLHGTSLDGYVELTGNLAIGSEVKGYLDVTMLRAPRSAPRFGEPCPRGLAECGDTSREVGGASRCIQVVKSNPTPICTRLCKANGDCSVGKGICSDGFCSKPCETHANCTPPTQCFASENGVDPSGCY